MERWHVVLLPVPVGYPYERPPPKVSYLAIQHCSPSSEQQQGSRAPQGPSLRCRFCIPRSMVSNNFQSHFICANKQSKLLINMFFFLLLINMLESTLWGHKAQVSKKRVTQWNCLLTGALIYSPMPHKSKHALCLRNKSAAWEARWEPACNYRMSTWPQTKWLHSLQMHCTSYMWWTMPSDVFRLARCLTK